jgi:hypothetical protein
MTYAENQHLVPTLHCIFYVFFFNLFGGAHGSEHTTLFLFLVGSSKHLHLGRNLLKVGNAGMRQSDIW